jgi:hypothetical protein
MPEDTQILYFGGRFSPDFKMEPHTRIIITKNIVAHSSVLQNNSRIYHYTEFS